MLHAANPAGLSRATSLIVVCLALRSGCDDDFQSLCGGCTSEGVVCLNDLIQREPMCNEARRIELFRLNDPQQLGVVTVSIRRVVIATLCDHSFSR